MNVLSIPKPCHENWAEFTPTEKGAFCGSCKIDVVDFSNKSPNEIKAILAENSGKHLCGRFKKSQITAINHDYTEWKNQSKQTFQSKFLYACLIVFGMSLFNSCHTESHLLNQENITQTDLNTQQTTPSESCDSTKIKNEYRKGKVAYHPISDDVIVPSDSTKKKNQAKDTLSRPIDDFIMGDVIMEPALTPLLDTTKKTQIKTKTN